MANLNRTFTAENGSTHHNNVDPSLKGTFQSITDVGLELSDTTLRKNTDHSMQLNLINRSLAFAAIGAAVCLTAALVMK